ncbi:MAG: hypothetical protein WAO23_06590 [Dethiobacteria bacterium]
MEQLELLWHLQERDMAIMELEKQLREDPLIAEVKASEGRLRREKEGLEEVGNDIKARQKEIKRQDLNLQSATDEIKNLKRRLYGGEVSNVRELEMMEKRLIKVKKEKDALENKIIELIEGLEAAEKAWESQKVIVTGCEKKVKDKRSDLKKQMAKIEQGIADLKLKREELLEKIDDHYLERYKVMCQRPDKKGMARVIDNICEGCRVFISSAQRGQLYNPQSMVYCENCGRLLVKFREDISSRQ